MTTTAEKIAALETALASGELTIESAGERVTYKSTADLITALNYFRGQEASAASSTQYGSTLASFGGGR